MLQFNYNFTTSFSRANGRNAVILLGSNHNAIPIELQYTAVCIAILL